MLLPNRYNPEPDYRYGFNGMEKDDELKGLGNSYDFGARMYDNRIGRWFSTDPDKGAYPYMSSYSYSLNSPIYTFDPNGRYAVSVHYRITYEAALKAGFSEEIADKMAHYASVYADHPPEGVLIFDNITPVSYTHLTLPTTSRV